MTVKELKIGESGKILSVGGSGELRQHFLDMGVIPGVTVTLIKYAPMGDPMEIRIFNYDLTLRKEEAANIQIELIKEVEKSEEENRAKLISQFAKNEIQTFHPCLGEDGKFHEKGTENPLPAGTTLTFALVGNQNCGKTTLFNQLTGSNQHVGNFPGVTVDRKDGVIKGHPDTLVTDLPGIYSMSPYTSEEIVSRNFILQEKPKAIINIIDATAIERNMYLTMQLLELDIPMVIAINMMDELVGNGGSININEMEAQLGVPVVPISAAKNQGVDELIKHAIHICKYQEKPQRQDFCDKDTESAVHRCIHGVIHLIHDHAEHFEIPVRFAASKIIEGDKIILNKLDPDQNEIEMLEHIVIQMEKERGLDRSAAMADMRYKFINRICAKTVKKPHESKEHIRSEKLDKILTGKYTAIPFFILIMCAVFFLTFNVIGAFLQSILESGIMAFTGMVENFFIRVNVNEVLRSLIINGIFAGVGSVLSFLPIIVTLFFFLSMMEDSGYIARVAFVMDKLLRKIGLSGRSIVPLLIGFGCTVPAVMSTRTLPSERDRKMTILLTPFMSCTAKLPIYAFLVSTFFPSRGGLIMTCLYIIGILLGILVALIFKKTLFKGEAVPFVMELPNYRMPGMKNVGQLLWEKAKDFLQRAFTIIFIATIIVWVLQSFDIYFNLVSDSANSILAYISGALVPIFKPTGLGDWRIITSLICGFMAKESVVSTMEILFGNVKNALSQAQAFSLLIFSLLYTPCVAAISSIKKELGRKWAIGVAAWQSVIAWIFATLVFMMFTGCSGKSANQLNKKITSENSRANEVIVYTYDSFVSEWGPGLEIEQMFEDATGYDLVWVNCGEAIQVLSRAYLEKRNPYGDVILGIDNNLSNKTMATQIVTPYKPKNADEFIQKEISAQLSSNWSFTPYDYSHFAIIYDTASKVPCPKSLDDLLNPVYKGKIILMDPRTSTPGLGFVTWTVAQYCNEHDIKKEDFSKVRDYWKALQPNILTMAPSWSTGYGLFKKGEAPLVISYTTSPASHVEYDNTDRYMAAIFDEGHSIQVEGAAILKGAPNIKGAEAFLDFLITEEVQSIIPLTQWMNPVNKNVKLPESYKKAAPIPSKTLSVKGDVLDKAVQDIMSTLGE